MTDHPLTLSPHEARAFREGRASQFRRVLKAAVPPMPAMDIHPNHVAKHDAPYLDAYCGERKTPENPRGMSTDWCWWTRDDRPGPAFKVSYVVGDRLWCRETWARAGDPQWLVAYRADGQCGAWGWDGDGRPTFNHHGYVLDPARRDLRGDYGLPKYGGRWRSSTQMPRWASRTTLTVTEVSVQRLHDISNEDCIASGVEPYPNSHAPRVGPVMDDFARTHGLISHYGGEFMRRWIKSQGRRSWDSNPWVIACTVSVTLGNIDGDAA